MNIENQKENFVFSDTILDSYQGIEVPPLSFFSKISTPFPENESFRQITKTKNLKLITTRESKKQKILNITRDKGTCSIIENRDDISEVNSHNKFVNTFKYVKNFIQTLKFRLSYKNHHNLNRDHLKIIDDVVFFKNFKDQEEISTKSEYFKKIEQSFCGFFHKRNLNVNLPIFSRNNRILLIWDIIILLISIFFIIWIPISFSFEKEINGFFEEKFHEVEKVAKIFFVLDVLLKFNISYYAHGNEIKYRKEIIKKYIKSGFIFDLFTLIGVYSDSDSFLKPMVLFKIITVTQYINLIRQLMILSEFEEGAIRIMLLMNKIVYIAHILACLFNLLSHQLIKNNYSYTSWIIEANLIDKPWTEKYINAFYWSIATLATVGYGDIVPRNSFEKLYCIIVMLIGSGIFAYNINKLSNIFGDISKNEREYLKNLKVLNQMMKRKKLNSELQNKVRNYFHYMYKRENKKQIEEENQLFNKLSQGLQKEIILNSYASILKQSNFFCNNFSEEFLQSIVFKMKPKLYIPEEIIFNEGEIDKNIYFLTQGKARIIYNNKKNDCNETVIYEIEAGDTFGESNLINNQEYRYSCKSTEFCSFYTINLKDFLQTLNQFPEDKEKYFMVKDSVLLYQNHEYFYKKCKLCESNYHLTENCQFINFQPHKERVFHKLVLENRTCCILERKKIIRREKKTSLFQIPERGTIFEMPPQSPVGRNLNNEIAEFKSLKSGDAISNKSSSNINSEDLFLKQPSRENYEKKESMNLNEKHELFILRNTVYSQAIIEPNYKHVDNNYLDSSFFDETLENLPNAKYLKHASKLFPENGSDVAKSGAKKSKYNESELFDFNFDSFKNFFTYFPKNNFNALMKKYKFNKLRKITINKALKHNTGRKSGVSKGQKRLFKSDMIESKLGI